jgi:hypothetical protein
VISGQVRHARERLPASVAQDANDRDYFLPLLDGASTAGESVGLGGSPGAPAPPPDAGARSPPPIACAESNGVGGVAADCAWIAVAPALENGVGAPAPPAPRAVDSRPETGASVGDGAGNVASDWAAI